MQVATWIVRALELYLAVGVLFALPFVWRGAQRLDPIARTGTLGFRAVIFPGSVLLWPWCAARLVRVASHEREVRR